MTDLSTMETDDDPVIKEIPVFLAKNLADKLYVFQYPIRPAEAGYDNAKFIKTMLKPKNQEALIEVEIDSRSATYDQSKGAQIAANADGVISKSCQENEERTFESSMMDKTILQSSRALPDCSNYSVGVYQDGELHITPLKSILQMRPQFNYFDKGGKGGKDETKNLGEDGEEEEEAVKQVNVTFARQKSDFFTKMREQSFQEQSKKSLEESWIETQYRETNSSQAELMRLDMYCSSTDESVNTLKLTRNEYLKMLAPPMKTEQYAVASASNHGTSLVYIRTLPLLDQIRILMKDAKILSFTQLRSILSTDHEAIAIIKYLQQVAVLVQGNWVVNSELIYPKDTISSHSGIAAELMCRARDYVLLCFTEHEYVDRKAVSSMIKLPSEEIKEIFVNLARHHAKRGWKLIAPSNKDFTERYPEIAQRQEMFWEAKKKHLREVMETQNQPPQRQRRKSNRESVGSENEERNVGRGRKTLRDSSVSDDSANDSVKTKKTNRARKVSENT
ncbi:DNA-directed RNA polymerase III subunit RPC5 [Venturia canescens]|uniref:DNA-directed RNA polymerase III subunit RPC5 n=1 Tax=Venturia canescens TaxID=32260 RepID=UPI001C9C73BC|nr:DNA-directed RNA polymerase III subunit RPC5 [Venturia canescens]XP_043280383.1 DNA-directed RNA polymerase III subunit RPC5 [Venturia canescens]